MLIRLGFLDTTTAASSFALAAISIVILLFS
jgi:hypothetical protein